ncbi:MAG: hypothetical protein ABI120_15020, partial [Gemmatimonadaceae bacterium]
TWRTALGGSSNSWKLSGYSDSALMRGTVLDEAVRLSRTRTDDLCADDLEFIQASVVARDNFVEKSKAAELQAAAHAQAASAKNAQLQSQIDQLGAENRKPATWFDRHGVKIGVVLGILAVAWIGLSTRRAALVQVAATARVDSVATAEARKLTDSVAALSRRNDSVVAVLTATSAMNGLRVRPPANPVITRLPAAIAPSKDREVAAASNNTTAALAEAQLFIRQIERDGARLTAESNSVTKLVTLARGSTTVRDSVRAASIRSKPTLEKLLLLYVLLRSGESREFSSLLNAAEYRPADLARVAATGIFTADQWASIVPVAVDALGTSDADVNWYRALARAAIPRSRIASDMRSVIVRSAYRASTSYTKDPEDRSAAAYSTVVAWSPEAAVVAASTVLSNDPRDPAVVTEISRAFAGTSSQYASGGLVKKFPELKLPSVSETSSAWNTWTKEHVDFVARWRPQQATGR